MKKNLLFLLAIFISPYLINAQLPCSPNSNVFIFSNYDGGNLNINVDMNLPNIQIGIVSYEPTRVTFSGPFASNVTAVRYTGYYPSGAGNQHCDPTITGFTVTGAPNANVSAAFADGGVFCAYTCAPDGGGGGCNTTSDVVNYFSNYFGNGYRHHTMQYVCWCGTYSLSSYANLGTCCSGSYNGPNNPISTTASNSGPTCVGGTIQLSTPSVGGATYSWTGPNGFSSSQQNPTITNVSTLNAGVYTVIVSAACGSTSASTSVTISTGPDFTVTTNSPVCPGDPIVYSTNVGGYSLLPPPNGIAWMNNGPSSGVQINSTAPSYVFGNYEFSYTLNGCTTTHIVPIIQDANCDTDGDGVPNISDPEPNNPCIPSVSYTASVVNQNTLMVSPSATTIQWIDCSTGNPIPGATNATFSPSVNGSYAAEISYSDSCTSTSNCVQLNTLGLYPIDEDNYLIYPNPTADFVHILGTSELMEIHVFDMFGSIVYENTFTNSVDVSLEILKQGVYLFELKSEEKVIKTQRVVKY